MPPPHTITRVRHPLRYRRLQVRRVEALAPGLRRIVLGGEDLEGFTSLGFDDHVKLFFPDATGRLPDGVSGDRGISFPDGAPRPEGRDFTPRRYDPSRQELTLDFALHGHGVATAWAAAATPGTWLAVAGPRGSAIVSDTFDWNLLIGDDTALPAIARRLEELPARVTALVVIEVDNPGLQLPLASAATADIRWVPREPAGTPALERAVAGLVLPPGEGFAWVAGEAMMARRIRHHLIHDRHLDPAWIKAAAYWRRGAAGTHEVLTD